MSLLPLLVSSLWCCVCGNGRFPFVTMLGALQQMKHKNERLVCGCSCWMFLMLQVMWIASKQQQKFPGGMKELHSLSEALCLICNIITDHWAVNSFVADELGRTLCIVGEGGSDRDEWGHCVQWKDSLLLATENEPLPTKICCQVSRINGG